MNRILKLSLVISVMMIIPITKSSSTNNQALNLQTFSLSNVTQKCPKYCKENSCPNQKCEKCIDGYYPITDSGECYNCLIGCKTCTTGDTCELCYEKGFFLAN